MVREVRWSFQAQQELVEAYQYILSSSLQNADKVKKDILLSTRKLAVYPGMYPPD